MWLEFGSDVVVGRDLYIKCIGQAYSNFAMSVEIVPTSLQERWRLQICVLTTGYSTN